jgi:hypothetical protein
MCSWRTAGRNSRSAGRHFQGLSRTVESPAYQSTVPAGGRAKQVGQQTSTQSALCCTLQDHREQNLPRKVLLCRSNRLNPLAVSRLVSSAAAAPRFCCATSMQAVRLRSKIRQRVLCSAPGEAGTQDGSSHSWREDEEAGSQDGRRHNRRKDAGICSRGRIRMSGLGFHSGVALGAPT